LKQDIAETPMNANAHGANASTMMDMVKLGDGDVVHAGDPEQI
jgi:hypothetical protein